ncbi:MAG: UvrD-helicase domain-containing protein [bacterium]
MSAEDFTIEDLWRAIEFKPNRAQEAAIRHTDGPLYLPAGPGSGKTRVLLWRTVNLIAFHDVPPEAIYLSTFTEKAALQLQEGLQALLGEVTNRTGKPYDYTQIYVGTVHSLCHRLLSDRRFTPNRERTRPPRLLDELGQYFHLYRRRNWDALLEGVGLDPEEDNLTLYRVFNPDYRYDSVSRHKVVTACRDFFNRVSEECIDPDDALQQLAAQIEEDKAYFARHDISPDGLDLLFRLYREYRESLVGRPRVPLTDFALLQQSALELLSDNEGSSSVFRHVIIDEYQDTNTIQERIFFKLAAGHKNLCVVGDDDQALYRFRGATVENFVEFPQRCEAQLGEAPTTIPLNLNYRSREGILEFYAQFVNQCDWSREDGVLFRVDKSLAANRKDSAEAVVSSTPDHPDVVCPQIARLVQDLVDSGRVQDPNQIAFLFPSLKSKMVEYTREALEDEGFEVYAPRAGRFLEVPEAVDMLGVFAKIFGLPPHRTDWGGDYGDFCRLLRRFKHRGEDLIEADPQLAEYVAHLREEIGEVKSDYQALMAVVRRRGWDLDEPYNPDEMKRPLYTAAGLSDRGRNALGRRYLDRVVKRRRSEGRPYSLRQIVRRVTSTDWTLLEIFHRVCGFRHFKRMIDLAQSGRDEGPIYNLALLSQYLARFVDEYVGLITGKVLQDGLFKRLFFMSFLLAIFRLGESEFEDSEDPFPKGRIPFLTIHQSKGLEFPVVVLGNPRKRNRGAQRNEVMVRPFLDRDPGEPLDRIGEFDIMRMYYVALSRAKNLLVVPYFRARGHYINREFREVADELPRIPELELETVPVADVSDDDLPRAYSYTGDYLSYKNCPRQYMMFREYGVVPARSQMMLFGGLVHRTLEDLHHYLIAREEEA